MSAISWPGQRHTSSDTLHQVTAQIRLPRPDIILVRKLRDRPLFDLKSRLYNRATRILVYLEGSGSAGFDLATALRSFV